MEARFASESVSTAERIGAALTSLVAGECLWIGAGALFAYLEKTDIAQAMVGAFFSIGNLVFAALALLAGFITGPRRLPGIIGLVLGMGTVEVEDRHWRAKLVVGALLIFIFVVFACFSMRPDYYYP